MKFSDYLTPQERLKLSDRDKQTLDQIPVFEDETPLIETILKAADEHYIELTRPRASMFVARDIAIQLYWEVQALVRAYVDIQHKLDNMIRALVRDRLKGMPDHVGVPSDQINYRRHGQVMPDAESSKQTLTEAVQRLQVQPDMERARQKLAAMGVPIVDSSPVMAGLGLDQAHLQNHYVPGSYEAAQQAAKEKDEAERIILDIGFQDDK